ncbi:MAG: hypothetical protein JWM57_479 [Phycisphaerales bacterium]|nr:hypothetical protein [Phycisphaerales bacterium]
MATLEDRRPASPFQVDKLIALGHERDKVMNLTGLQAKKLIAKGRHGPAGPVAYAWKKNAPAES